MDKAVTEAIIGAGAGVATGKSVKSAASGAVIGAGTGAMLQHGEKGKKARKGGVVGAAAGAGVAAATGHNVLKGAAIGAGTGGVIGKSTR